MVIAEWEGGCACRSIRYRLEKSPLVVHCCHCTWCQKETGSAFALIAMIETNLLTLLSSERPRILATQSGSGRGQAAAHCPNCVSVLWSTFAIDRDLFTWIRVGTLDDPSKAPPSVHIYTRSKLPWVVLDASVPVREVYYDREEVWSKSSLERHEKLVKQVST